MFSVVWDYSNSKLKGKQTETLTVKLQIKLKSKFSLILGFVEPGPRFWFKRSVGKLELRPPSFIPLFTSLFTHPQIPTAGNTLCSNAFNIILFCISQWNKESHLIPGNMFIGNAVPEDGESFVLVCLCSCIFHTAILFNISIFCTILLFNLLSPFVKHWHKSAWTCNLKDSI